jgi:exopolyphosphatase/pppGpp-phosphohydrolase
MSYDRKLKNAVSKSVIELLAREGIDLRWEMLVDGTAHSLTGAELSSRTATHLGKTQLVLAKSGDRVALTETLHSDAYIEMVAASFDGRTAVPLSIAANLHQIDWEASAKSPSHKSSNQERPTRPRSGRDRHPNQSG